MSKCHIVGNHMLQLINVQNIKTCACVSKNKSYQMYSSSLDLKHGSSLLKVLVTCRQIFLGKSNQSMDASL